MVYTHEKASAKCHKDILQMLKYAGRPRVKHIAVAFVQRLRRVECVCVCVCVCVFTLLFGSTK